MRAIYFGAALVAAGTVALFLGRLLAVGRVPERSTLQRMKDVIAAPDEEQRRRDAIGRTGR